MRFLSVADNRLLRACPPLRPKAFAMSDAFMTDILLSAKQKSKAGRLWWVGGPLMTAGNRERDVGRVERVPGRSAGRRATALVSASRCRYTARACS